MTIYIDTYQRNLFTFIDFGFNINDLIPSGFKTPWGIITAWNPDNKQFPREMNDERNSNLREMLIKAGYIITEGKGGCDEHFEDSFLVEKITFEETVKFGKMFGQYSIYWCDGKTSGYYLCENGEPILVR